MDSPSTPILIRSPAVGMRTKAVMELSEQAARSESATIDLPSPMPAGNTHMPNNRATSSGVDSVETVTLTNTTEDGLVSDILSFMLAASKGGVTCEIVPATFEPLQVTLRLQFPAGRSSINRNDVSTLSGQNDFPSIAVSSQSLLEEMFEHAREVTREMESLMAAEYQHHILDGEGVPVFTFPFAHEHDTESRYPQTHEVLVNMLTTLTAPLPGVAIRSYHIMREQGNALGLVVTARWLRLENDSRTYTLGLHIRIQLQQLMQAPIFKQLTAGCALQAAVRRIQCHGFPTFLCACILIQKFARGRMVRNFYLSHRLRLKQAGVAVEGGMWQAYRLVRPSWGPEKVADRWWSKSRRRRSSGEGLVHMRQGYSNEPVLQEHAMQCIAGLVSDVRQSSSRLLSSILGPLKEAREENRRRVVENKAHQVAVSMGKGVAEAAAKEAQRKQAQKRLQSIRAKAQVAKQAARAKQLQEYSQNLMEVSTSLSAVKFDRFSQSAGLNKTLNVVRDMASVTDIATHGMVTAIRSSCESLMKECRKDLLPNVHIASLVQLLERYSHESVRQHCQQYLLPVLHKVAYFGIQGSDLSADAFVSILTVLVNPASSSTDVHTLQQHFQPIVRDALWACVRAAPGKRTDASLHLLDILSQDSEFVLAFGDGLPNDFREDLLTLISILGSPVESYPAGIWDPVRNTLRIVAAICRFERTRKIFIGRDGMLLESIRLAMTVVSLNMEMPTTSPIRKVPLKVSMLPGGTQLYMKKQERARSLNHTATEAGEAVGGFSSGQDCSHALASALQLLRRFINLGESENPVEFDFDNMRDCVQYTVSSAADDSIDALAALQLVLRCTNLEDVRQKQLCPLISGVNGDAVLATALLLMVLSPKQPIAMAACSVITVSCASEETLEYILALPQASVTAKGLVSRICSTHQNLQRLSSFLGALSALTKLPEHSEAILELDDDMQNAFMRQLVWSLECGKYMLARRAARLLANLVKNCPSAAFWSPSTVSKLSACLLRHLALGDNVTVLECCTALGALATFAENGWKLLGGCMLFISEDGCSRLVNVCLFLLAAAGVKFPHREETNNLFEICSNFLDEHLAKARVDNLCITTGLAKESRFEDKDDFDLDAGGSFTDFHLHCCLMVLSACCSQNKARFELVSACYSSDSLRDIVLLCMGALAQRNSRICDEVVAATCASCLSSLAQNEDVCDILVAEPWALSLLNNSISGVQLAASDHDLSQIDQQYLTDLECCIACICLSESYRRSFRIDVYDDQNKICSTSTLFQRLLEHVS